MAKIDDALVERCVALCREIADGNGAFFSAPYFETARAIVAELPAPVDADLLIAREIVAADPVWTHIAEEVIAGHWDDSATVRIALAALRRARGGGGQ